VAGIYLIGGCRIVELGSSFRSLAALGSIAALLAGFVLQSSVEELLFRGWMLSAIRTKLGVGWGVVLSSLAFTVMHFDPRGNWIFKMNVFLFAVFACCWVIRTGNVWGVMGWHSGWNWLLAVGFEWRVTALGCSCACVAGKSCSGWKQFCEWRNRRPGRQHSLHTRPHVRDNVSFLARTLADRVFR